MNFLKVAVRKYWLGALIGLYLLSGFYIVGSDEVGVVRLFGKVWQPRVQPGLHYRPPFPFSRLDKVKVRQVRRAAIGMEVADVVLQKQPQPFRMQFLTGDQNIVNLQAIVQFTVRDPVRFLFAASEPERIIQCVAEAAMAKEVAQISVDDILTVGKIGVQNRVRGQVQRLLDEVYDLGVTVVAVTIQKVSPPDQVKDAFDAVTKARQSRHQRILEAQSYANTVIPQARGEAQRLLNEAIAYRDRVVAEAKGNADKFLALLSEYRKAKDVTKTRLYIEAMEELLPKIKKVIVDPRGGKLDIGMIRREPAGSTPQSSPSQ
jgi:membrane protease subunit HflK